MDENYPSNLDEDYPLILLSPNYSLPYDSPPTPNDARDVDDSLRPASARIYPLHPPPVPPLLVNSVQVSAPSAPQVRTVWAPQLPLVPPLGMGASTTSPADGPFDGPSSTSPHPDLPPDEDLDAFDRLSYGVSHGINRMRIVTPRDMTPEQRVSYPAWPALPVPVSLEPVVDQSRNLMMEARAEANVPRPWSEVRVDIGPDVLTAPLRY